MRGPPRMGHGSERTAGLEHEAHRVDIGRGDERSGMRGVQSQLQRPANLDHEGPGGPRIAGFESGAIMTHFAEDTGELLVMKTRCATPRSSGCSSISMARALERKPTR
jgi:hypothetical protein